MRILYVSKETPLKPSGGIATYLQYMIPAMEAAGHEVYLFSWIEEEGPLGIDNYAPFRPDHVHFEVFNKSEAWRVFPVSSHNLTVSHWLAEKIKKLMIEWKIDVVESTDYLSPCLVAYQKIQSESDSNNHLLVTYNHGFIEDFYEADQLNVGADASTDHLCERQQCRISDLIIAPSSKSKQRIKHYGIEREIALVREPFLFSENERALSDVRNDIEYIGRISISKGIDKLILLTNVLNDVYPLRQVRLFGRVVNTPFRNYDMKNYVLSRIAPSLRESVFFYGYLKREIALGLLEAGSISPSLGSAETFSYACLESIEAGHLPVVRHDTPMAEFFPPHLEKYILDAEMRSVNGMQTQLLEILKNGQQISSDVKDHCRETLNPKKIAEEMGKIYEEKLKKKKNKTLHAKPNKNISAKDITFLLPVYKPNHEFFETIDSISWQTAGLCNVIICDDGTPDSHTPWFDYAKAVLPNCRIIRQPNSGLLAARNTLVENSKTDVSIFLDADDILDPEFLGKLIDGWNNSPFAPDAVIPQRTNFGESAEAVLTHRLDDHMHILNNDYRMTALIRTSILRSIGFDSTRRNGEGDDWAFWLEFTMRSHTGVMVPYPGFLYRFRRGSMSWPWSQGQEVGTQSMIRKISEEMCSNNPKKVSTLTRALYSLNTINQN